MTINWWTLGLQAVNVLILIWLLSRFFWRPISAIIDQRRTAAATLLSDAQAARTQAADALADIERVRAGFAQERADILKAAQEAAEQARATLLAQAEADAEAVRAAARDTLDQERQAAARTWRDHAGRLAVDIAGKLLAGMDGTGMGDAFLTRLVGEISALPPDARAQAANGAALTACTATALPTAERERYRQRIVEALGRPATIDFTVDPALLAGLELRGPHLAITNSWRADLARILQEISHDDRP
ncbi:ATP synthase F0 subunit B [Nitrospirillum iridis]|uniref:ATP synthase subunit b n=1 Tax=Nitrospirillum iridis TaxID=765888 RepID=A0A7X0EFR0_9PROT|nr:ATP synthase F0 subunit B [Nitrospirillum iridis]MBB6254235.1 F-type H+-transporting ATPase subunit b [Nitrospirillum iridis]